MKICNVSFLVVFFVYKRFLRMRALSRFAHNGWKLDCICIRKQRHNYDCLGQTSQPTLVLICKYQREPNSWLGSNFCSKRHGKIARQRKWHFEKKIFFVCDLLVNGAFNRSFVKPHSLLMAGIKTVTWKIDTHWWSLSFRYTFFHTLQLLQSSKLNIN